MQIQLGGDEAALEASETPGGWGKMRRVANTTDTTWPIWDLNHCHSAWLRGVEVALPAQDRVGVDIDCGRYWPSLQLLGRWSQVQRVMSGHTVPR